MSEIGMFSALLGVLGTISAITFGFAAYKRNNRTDNKDEGEKSGTILTEIGYIKAGVDDIKRKQEKQDALYIDVVTKLTSVEASAKQAHKRIDRLEGATGREE